ncbi:hypothetical protein KKB64_03700 [Patescibacteria group bacterium]|nr:hypothetical protein [Patescibacteria group bacterium]MBU1472862.1 hypothetical protein [Patescibacteria group bacterium]MBU2459519.1 hypothetical protein [Patescibacteria group bacterium]MBU2543968.1 hypothetical protein [Patescibacteria group bacterium]
MSIRKEAIDHEEQTVIDNLLAVAIQTTIDADGKRVSIVAVDKITPKLAADVAWLALRRLGLQKLGYEAADAALGIHYGIKETEANS